jgi:sec-independent protein translocase protein TatC
MPRPADDDLFQSSTMTFGEHLEELRTCLIRAAAGLAVTVLIGFLVARPVVHLIEDPLRRALGDYYSKRALETAADWKARTPGGVPLPYSQDEIRDAVEQHAMTFELREVHPDRLAAVIGGTAARAAAASGTAAFDTDALVPVLLWQPLTRDPRVSITTLSAQEAFGIYVKAAMLVGVVLASPWIFYQLWTFVAAGLYRHERKWVWTFLPISVALFLAGVFIAFFFVFDFVLDYLLQFNAWLGLDPDPRISEWMSFVLIMPIGFGLGFQLPLVMLFLERIGVLDVAAYVSQWRMAVLVIVVVSAILTPADPYSMLFLAAPLCLLYFGGVALCRWFGDGPRSPRIAAAQATKASQ